MSFLPKDLEPWTTRRMQEFTRDFRQVADLFCTQWCRPTLEKAIAALEDSIEAKRQDDIRRAKR